MSRCATHYLRVVHIGRPQAAATSPRESPSSRRTPCGHWKSVALQFVVRMCYQLSAVLTHLYSSRPVPTVKMTVTHVASMTRPCTSLQLLYARDTGLDVCPPMELHFVIRGQRHRAQMRRLCPPARCPPATQSLVSPYAQLSDPRFLIDMFSLPRPLSHLACHPSTNVSLLPRKNINHLLLPSFPCPLTRTPINQWRSQIPCRQKMTSPVMSYSQGIQPQVPSTGSKIYPVT